MSTVLIVGGGPAGAVCAALCAQAGWRTTLLERAVFPREKVCGDCLNPDCWPILERLGLAERVRELPHARLSTVEFIDARGRSLAYPLPPSAHGEIAVKRSDLDALLLNHARARGATVQEGAAVTAVERLDDQHWQVTAGEQRHMARYLVAADGRNSTVARLRGLLPPAAKDRVGLQTHLPLPEGVRERVIMRFLPQGYCGMSDVGGGRANLCLVARPADLERVKAWAAAQFGLGEQQVWRSITPLQRAPAAVRDLQLLLTGDAARVVEPFTGEGIYYAMASGALAADCLVRGEAEKFRARHRELYRGRLWVNVLARAACTHPAVASAMLGMARVWPAGLGILTRKVVVR